MNRALSFIGLTLLAFAASGAARSSDLVVSTGRQAGSYYYIGKRLQSAVRVYEQRPPRIDVLTSAGSIENLTRLADPASPVNVALAQKDALHRFLDAQPRFADDLLILGDVGRECALLISRAGGPLRTAADLKKKQGLTLSVGAQSSGAAVTWANLVAQDPAFGNTRTSDLGAMEAMLQLDVGGDLTNVGAVLVVQRPRRESGPLKLLMKSPDVYRLVPFREREVASPKLPDGSPIYTFDTVEVGGSLSRDTLEVETLCTRGLLVGSKSKIDPKRREQLSSIMLERGSEIKGKE